MSAPKIPPQSLSRLWPAEDQERLGAGVNNAVRALQLGVNKMAVDVSAWWTAQRAQAAKQLGVDPARLKPELFAWRIAPEPGVEATTAQERYNARVAQFPGAGPTCGEDEKWAEANGVSRPAVRQLRRDNTDPRLHRKGPKKQTP